MLRIASNPEKLITMSYNIFLSFENYIAIQEFLDARNVYDSSTLSSYKKS
jgi:hypothetical protein